MKMVLATVLLCPGILLADEWVPLDGAGITAALTDREVHYQSASQRFYASGRTLYNAGQDSWGYWAVRGNQYCSQWPPADGWDCYDVQIATGQVRFIAADGSTTDGILVE